MRARLPTIGVVCGVHKNRALSSAYVINRAGMVGGEMSVPANKLLCL